MAKELKRGEVIRLEEDCVMVKLNHDILSHCQKFECGNADLDEFFNEDAILYDTELLGKTYCWILKESPDIILAAFTLANDSIKTHGMPNNIRNRIQRSVANPKRGRTYPAVLIGRLGVNIAYQGDGNHIGTQVMDFIKKWFRSEDNKTGCRFIVVDAVNTPSTIGFYTHSRFKPIYIDESFEKDFFNIDSEDCLRTRMMYFDLKL